MIEVGVDEVGRGALIGNVVASAVILNKPILGLKDSKKLSQQSRERLSWQIKEKSYYAIAKCSASEVDEYNIHFASLMAMQRALLKLEEITNFTQQKHKVYIDGKYVPQFDGDHLFNMQTIIKGDEKVNCISAASIIAKVARDTEIENLSELYPQYGLAQNKGYATKEHKLAIKKFGVLEEHRKSFRPICDD